MPANILIVDDEDSIRISLRGILEDEGYTVSEAASGKEALDYLSAHSSDLVLLDVNKTEESILQVVQTIETKTRVFEQRIDILDDHREARLELCWEEIALEEVANHALFIHNILTDNGDFFLKILDLDQYLFIHLVGGVDFTRKFGDEVGSILDHIRIFFYTSLHE